MSDGSQVWGGAPGRDALDPTLARPALGRRLLGGPPAVVAVRLVAASLVVGAFMMWLRIEPTDVALAVAHALHHLWAMGFLAADQIGRYLLAGAAVVLPLWALSRVLSLRGTR